MAVSSLGIEKTAFCIVQSGKEICLWGTPGLAEAEEARIIELPFIVLKKVSAQCLKLYSGGLEDRQLRFLFGRKCTSSTALATLGINSGILLHPVG